MMPAYLTISTLENIGQVLVLVLILVFILALTYFVTKWIAKSTRMQSHAKNIQVIETFQIAQSKYIQIVKVADQYLAIAVTKDTVTMLTELNKDGIVLPEKPAEGNISFQEILHKITGKGGTNKTDK